MAEPVHVQVDCRPRWFWKIVRPFAQVVFVLLPVAQRAPFAAWLASWCWSCRAVR